MALAASALACCCAGPARSQSRQTHLLLFPFGGDKTASIQVTTAVKAALKQGGSLMVTEFRQDLPSIKRAILERRISRGELTSSDPAARTSLAKALEADYFITGEAIQEPEMLIVSLFSTRVRTGAKAEFTSRAARPSDGGASNTTLILSASNTVVSQFLTEVLNSLPPAAPVIVTLPDPPPDNNAGPVTPNPDPGTTGPTAPANPPTMSVPPAPTRNPDEEAAGFVAQAESLATSGDLAGAIQAMRSAINVSPRDPKLRVRLSEFYNQKGMPEQASAELESAMALGPTDPDAKSGLAEQLMAAGKTEEAEKVYRQMLKDNPNDVQARIGLGDALWSNGKANDAALEYAQAANEAKSDPVPHEKLARLYASRGQFTESMSNLQAAAKRRSRQPDDPIDSDLYMALIKSADISFRRHLDTLDSESRQHAAGSSTRENYFKKIEPMLAEIDDHTDFLSAITPPASRTRPHLHRTLASSLLAQGVSALEDWLIKGTADQKTQYEQLYRESKAELDSAVRLERSL